MSLLLKERSLLFFFKIVPTPSFHYHPPPLLYPSSEHLKGTNTFLSFFSFLFFPLSYRCTTKEKPQCTGHWSIWSTFGKSHFTGTFKWKKLAYILLRKIHMFSLFMKKPFIAAMSMTCYCSLELWNFYEFIFFSF